MFENQKFYNCEIVLDDGQKYLVAANWLHNNNLDHWHGWSCDAGHKRLDIDKNFDVWGGVCHNDYLGNVFGHWRLLDGPTKCKKNRCTSCTDDLLIEKHGR